MEHFEHRDSYETGSTRPPKHHRGFIAVLLALVIFLGGLSSILSIMNIRLFKQLSPDPIAISFSPAPETDGTCNISALGIHGEDIPETYRRYYRLPAGVYIIGVRENGPGAAAGLQESDIILSINGKPVRSANDLNAHLGTFQNGQQVLVIYQREYTLFSTTVTIGGK